MIIYDVRQSYRRTLIGHPEIPSRPFHTTPSSHTSPPEGRSDNHTHPSVIHSYLALDRPKPRSPNESRTAAVKRWSRSVRSSRDLEAHYITEHCEGSIEVVQLQWSHSEDRR